MDSDCRTVIELHDDTTLAADSSAGRIKEAYQFKCNAAGILVADLDVKEDTGALWETLAVIPGMPAGSARRAARTLRFRHDDGGRMIGL